MTVTRAQYVRDTYTVNIAKKPVFEIATIRGAVTVASHNNIIIPFVFVVRASRRTPKIYPLRPEERVVYINIMVISQLNWTPVVNRVNTTRRRRRQQQQRNKIIIIFVYAFVTASFGNIVARVTVEMSVYTNFRWFVRTSDRCRHIARLLRFDDNYGFSAYSWWLYWVYVCVWRIGIKA